MNTYLVKLAVFPGVLALAAIVLSLVIPFPADVVVGFAAAIAVLGLMAQDYGSTPRGALGR
jgi:hypothetical protein